MNSERPLILLVEDNPADVHLVAEALAEARIECELSVLRDGLQALEFLERLDTNPSQPCPDLILLDLNLPKIGGNEVLGRLRLSPKCKDVEVLVISSSDAPADRQKSLDLGASGYFRKPSNLNHFMKLGSIIRGLLESASGLPPCATDES